MLYTSLADANGVEKLVEKAVETKRYFFFSFFFAIDPGINTNSAIRYNIAFTCLLLLGRVHACLDLLVKAGKIPEAVFMARSYAPSRVSQLLALWYAFDSFHEPPKHNESYFWTYPKKEGGSFQDKPQNSSIACRPSGIS